MFRQAGLFLCTFLSGNSCWETGGIGWGELITCLITKKLKFRFSDQAVKTETNCCSNRIAHWVNTGSKLGLKDKFKIEFKFI